MDSGLFHHGTGLWSFAIEGIQGWLMIAFSGKLGGSLQCKSLLRDLLPDAAAKLYPVGKQREEKMCNIVQLYYLDFAKVTC